MSSCIYSLSPESLCTNVSNSSFLYKLVKNFVKTYKEDPYTFFLASVQMQKFKISCCNALLPAPQLHVNCVCSDEYKTPFVDTHTCILQVFYQNTVDLVLFD